MIAISSAYKEALIAIDIDGKQSFLAMDSNCKHSENILFNIDKMLDEMGKNIKDNDCLAVVTGPGSFTGLRIGIALVKGLKEACGCKTIGIYTPELIAHTYLKQSHPNDDFYVAIDALSGLIYISKFTKDGIMFAEQKLITREEYQNLDGNKVGLSEECVADVLVRPSPQDLLEVANEKLARNETADDKDLNPLYLRKSQAEVSLENKINAVNNR